MSSEGLYTVLSGVKSSTQALDVLANNLANVNSTGFRGDRPSFQEQVIAANNEGPRSSIHVAVDAVHTSDTAGSLRSTGNPLDVALQGDGFITVRNENGLRLTRAGSFVTDREGVLRTTSGDEVVNRDGGDIRIPPNAREISILNDGTVTADEATVGTLRIVEVDQEDLRKEGGVLFSANPGTELREDTQTVVLQGHLENANVNVVSGMTSLVNATRLYGLFRAAMKTFQKIDEKAANQIAGRG